MSDNARSIIRNNAYVILYSTTKQVFVVASLQEEKWWITYIDHIITYLEINHRFNFF